MPITRARSDNLQLNGEDLTGEKLMRWLGFLPPDAVITPIEGTVGHGTSEHQDIIGYRASWIEAL